jgi:hypothetical protein
VNSKAKLGGFVFEKDNFWAGWDTQSSPTSILEIASRCHYTKHLEVQTLTSSSFSFLSTGRLQHIFNPRRNSHQHLQELSQDAPEGTNTHKLAILRLKTGRL